MCWKGVEGYEKLSAGYEDNHAESLVLSRHKESKNTLFATLHLRNVLDTAAAHNNFFVSSGGKMEIADINDVIVNPMMAFLDIGGMAVYDVLRISGGIDEALPIRSAKKHGMDIKARKYIARLAKSALEARLSKGIAVHWALTGTRAKKIMFGDGSVAMSVNKVDPSVAEYILQNFDLAVPIPIDMQPGKSELEVLPSRKLESEKDVHTMMQDMVEVVNDFSDKPICYGLPVGAELAENV